ncbi:hypothetical protein GGR57DRAFT_504159 [Xylariaceae sp. FL1272]|nr:hypothetical protein GGR57DRAFT_504159 [Xylariaceae sp. FL1272]
MSSSKSANGEKRAGFPRFIPDSNRLTFDGPPRDLEVGEGEGDGTGANGYTAPTLRYEDAHDLNAISRLQIEQDLLAYRYDLNFCETQMKGNEDLTPEDVRKLQLRILDCSHSIRHCKHRLQTSDAQRRANGYGAGPAVVMGYAGRRNTSTGRPRQIKKRKIDHVAGGSSEAEEGVANGDDTGNANGDAKEDANGDANRDAGNTTLSGEADAETSKLGGADDSIVIADNGEDASLAGPAESLQRLGFWNCRLCQSRKYAEAGFNKVPSAPSKWPLKDIAKMCNHFLSLHTEHTPEERCIELGDALARNRGPFKYWLTRTKNMSEMTPVDDFIAELRAGSLPQSMRPLLPAAKAFPNTTPNTT